MRKRSVVYSQRLTSDHKHYKLFRKLSGLFGYEMVSSSSEGEAVQLLLEGGELVLFCDEELYYALFADKVAAIEGKKGHVSVALIGTDAAEGPKDPSGRIDGCISLAAKAGVIEQLLFSIFKNAVIKEQCRTLSGKTDTGFVKQLLTKTSHAVNNILTGMQGYSELAQMHPDDRKLIQDSFDVVLESSQRIKNEIRRLCAFARIESPRFDEVSIAQILAESLRLAESKFRANRIGFDKSVDQDFIVNGDGDQLVQVFYYLLTEIAGLCDEGGSVYLSTSSINEEAVITIRGLRSRVDDETHTVLKELLSLEIPVLEMESKDGKVESHNVLSICGRIVRNHGGDIFLRREEGRSLVFRVRLPVLSRPSEAGDIEKTPYTQVYDHVDTLDMDILVVDDEEYVRNTLYYFFARKGCRVTLAGDGEFGLKIAREKHFDLIFMDYLMPKMGGIEAARRIREGDSKVKIAFITGREPFDEEELYRAGVFACVKKPFEIRELYTIAKKVAMEIGIIG